MILETKPFREACRKILAAIDTKDKESVLFTETLELKAVGDVLTLNVTNREYYVSVAFKLNSEEAFHASVNAKLFLNLVAKLTTDNLTLTKDNNVVKIAANGNYKIPMIFGTSGMLELPTIELGTITNEMSINSSILHSVAIYNGKELERGEAKRLAGNYYYIDELGAITFTSGACINSFTLEKPIKMLLDPKVVGLFRLFKSDIPVKFSVGQTEDLDGSALTIVRFEADNISITTKLKDANLISTVPVAPLRELASKTYPHSVVLNKDVFMDALDRIILFGKEQICGIKVEGDTLTIYDAAKENEENVKFENSYNSAEVYTMNLKLNALRSIVNSIDEQYITMNFGDHKAVCIKRTTICDLLSEYK